MWLRGLWMGKETRALSGDPVLHLLSPLPWSLCWKPVSSGVCVCVKGKESGVCSPLPSQLRRFTKPPLLFDFLVYIQKLYWHDMFITDGIVKAWRPNLPKAYTRWHKPCRYERLQGSEHTTDEVLIGANKCKGRTLDPTEMFRLC